MKVHTETMKTIIVAKALISGFKPRLTLEHTTSGKVDQLGPATNEVITKSSIAKVKANNHPEIIAGIMDGKVM